MPAHALIRLERLRGTDDHSIIEQLLKTAACVALAVVLLFGSGFKNDAMASMTYDQGIQTQYKLSCFWKRMRRALSTAIQELSSALRGFGMLRAT